MLKSLAYQFATCSLKSICTIFSPTRHFPVQMSFFCVRLCTSWHRCLCYLFVYEWSTPKNRLYRQISHSSETHNTVRRLKCTDVKEILLVLILLLFYRYHELLHQQSKRRGGCFFLLKTYFRKRTEQILFIEIGPIFISYKGHCNFKRESISMLSHWPWRNNFIAFPKR